MLKEVRVFIFMLFLFKYIKNIFICLELIIKDAYQNVLREIALMKKMDHPNIIRLHEVIFDEEKGKLYLVLEYAEKGQLIEWDEENEKFYFVNGREEKYMKEEDLLPIFQDCVLGLVYRNYFIFL